MSSLASFALPERLNPLVRTSISRAAVGVGAFVVVGALGGADGGYSATSWGWAALALAWLAATALFVRDHVSFSRPGLLFMGGLTGLLAWTALSVAWSDSATRSVLESQRTMVYAAAAVALLTLVRPNSSGALLGGTLAGIVAVCSYGLGTRITPERFHLAESVAAFRLSQPIGYWNGLGILTTIGVILAVGFLARGQTIPTRVLAAATLPMLITTLYLTFSRGAWIALAIGIALAIVTDPRRLQLIVTLAIAAGPPALSVWFASRSPAFTSVVALDIDAVREGHRLGVVVIAATVAASLLAFGLAWVEPRVRVSAQLTRALTRALVLLAIAVSLGATARFGMPWTVAASLEDAFLAPPTPVETSLNERLFDLSGSGRNEQWRVAYEAFEDRPLLGGGAGTYEFDWLEHRPLPGKVRDAHSLYLETLAEMGVVGLTLLAVALSAPLMAARRARRLPLVPFALGAYVALLAHAAVDWNWELPAVMVAGFAAAAVLIVGGGEGTAPTPPRLRWTVAAFAVGLGMLAFIGLLGNTALADSRAAARDGRWQESAARARDAERWAPWSSEPWRREGLAQPTAEAGRPYLLRAIAKEPNNWELHLELAWASTGKDRVRALRRASALNPLSPEVAAYRLQLAEEHEAASG